MTADQFAELLAELKTIKFVLIVASMLIAASAALASFRMYRYVKEHVAKGLDTRFRNDGLDLLERGRLDELISRCHDMLRARPNHVYAHWYLGRAYFLQERWQEAREAFESVRRINPDWSDSVESYVDDIGEKGGSS